MRPKNQDENSFESDQPGVRHLWRAKAGLAGVLTYLQFDNVLHSALYCAPIVLALTLPQGEGELDFVGGERLTSQIDFPSGLILQFCPIKPLGAEVDW